VKSLATNPLMTFKITAFGTSNANTLRLNSNLSYPDTANSTLTKYLFT